MGISPVSEWTKAEDRLPDNDIDVDIRTKKGLTGTAKHWACIGKWLTCDEHLVPGDIVHEWKYKR